MNFRFFEVFILSLLVIANANDRGKLLLEKGSDFGQRARRERRNKNIPMRGQTAGEVKSVARYKTTENSRSA